MRRQIVSTKSASKNSSEILSYHSKHLCVFFCLQDKMWIKMPKWGIFDNWEFLTNFLTHLFDDTIWRQLICLVHYIFNFSCFGQNKENWKNQLYCLSLKVTADESATLPVELFKHQKNKPLLIYPSRCWRDSKEPKTKIIFQFSRALF